MSFDQEFYRRLNQKEAESPNPPPPVTNYLSNTDLVEQAFKEYQDAINVRIKEERTYNAFVNRSTPQKYVEWQAAHPFDCSRGNQTEINNCLDAKIAEETARLKSNLDAAIAAEKTKKAAYESIATASNVPIITPANGIQNMAGMSTTSIVIIIVIAIVITIFLARKSG